MYTIEDFFTDAKGFELSKVPQIHCMQNGPCDDDCLVVSHCFFFLEVLFFVVVVAAANPGPEKNQ